MIWRRCKEAILCSGLDVRIQSNSLSDHVSKSYHLQGEKPGAQPTSLSVKKQPLLLIAHMGGFGSFLWFGGRSGFCLVFRPDYRMALSDVDVL